MRAICELLSFPNRELRFHRFDDITEHSEREIPVRTTHDCCKCNITDVQ